jgi:hypothetical protein
VPADREERVHVIVCASAGVPLLPGSVYDEPEYTRIGFGRANMPEALRLLEEILASW